MNMTNCTNANTAYGDNSTVCYYYCKSGCQNIPEVTGYLIAFRWEYSFYVTQVFIGTTIQKRTSGQTEGSWTEWAAI